MGYRPSSIPIPRLSSATISTPNRADLDGFLTLAEQYAALDFDLIDVMPPVDAKDPVGLARHLGEHVITRMAQLSVAAHRTR